MRRPTEAEQKQWDDEGVLFLEHALVGEELARLQATFDRCAAEAKTAWLEGIAKGTRPAAHFDIPNALEKDDLFIDLIDHPSWYGFLMDFAGLELQVKYFSPQLRENVSYKGSHKKIQLNRKRSIVAERIPVIAAREIPAAARLLFENSFICREGENCGRTGPPDHESFGDLSRYERVLPGLQNYF